MQHDAIILELLSRIKKLEDDVTELKQVRIGKALDYGNSAEEDDGQVWKKEAISYSKVTDEMIEACYECGKKVAFGEHIQDMADYVAESTGMNRNTAFMHLYVVQCMIDGNVYKRAISAKATKAYYDGIINDFGDAGLKLALCATAQHLAYREENGITAGPIENVYNEYKNRIV